MTRKQTRARSKPHDHTARWNKLSPSTQCRSIIRLIYDVVGREIACACIRSRAKGGRLKLNSVRIAIARDLAILDVLRGIVAPSVWEDAIAIAEHDPLDPKATTALRKKYAAPGAAVKPGGGALPPKPAFRHKTVRRA